MAITSIKTGSSFTNLQKYNDFLGPNAPFIPTSFESIATATGTGSSGTITFSSIPSTYKHLQIRFIARAASGGDTLPVNLQFRLNGDNGANYTQHNLSGDGTSALATGFNTTDVAGEPFFRNSYAGSGMAANIMGVGIIDIHDYASTTKNKTLRTLSGTNYNSGTTGERIVLSSHLWTNTAAITSITLTSGGARTFATTTVFSLYGIKG